MAASRPAQAGIPISVKLILATSFVVAAAVLTATWFSTTSISDLTALSIKYRRETGQEAITRESELVVKAVANAIALPLSQSQFGEVQLLLEGALQDDRADLERRRKETGMPATERVQWLVVTDSSGQIVASAPQAPPDPARIAALDKQLQGSNTGTVVHAQIAGGTDWA